MYVDIVISDVFNLNSFFIFIFNKIDRNFFPSMMSRNCFSLQVTCRWRDLETRYIIFFLLREKAFRLLD